MQGAHFPCAGGCILAISGALCDVCPPPLPVDTGAAGARALAMTDGATATELVFGGVCDECTDNSILSVDAPLFERYLDEVGMVMSLVEPESS
jgi:hypothetical protein